MVLKVFIYSCMVVLAIACSGEASDGLSAARAEPTQAGRPGPPVDKSAGSLRGDAGSDGETARMARDLQNSQAELAAARKRADEQQERARQATEAVQQARAQIERLTRALAALRRSEASKSRERVACKRASAELQVESAEPEPPPEAPDHLLGGGQQQACDLPRLIFKRSDVLN